MNAIPSRSGTLVEVASQSKSLSVALTGPLVRPTKLSEGSVPFDPAAGCAECDMTTSLLRALVVPRRVRGGFARAALGQC